MDDSAREQVEWLKKTYVDWLHSLQKNAIDAGSVIEPEVIGAAFKELAEYYKILDDSQISDEELYKFFRED